LFDAPFSMLGRAAGIAEKTWQRKYERMIEQAIQLTQRVKASPKTVYEQWVQPENLVKWWCTPGFTFQNVEIHPTPGGSYLYELQGDATKGNIVCTVEGRFQAVTPGETLRYSWTLRVPGFEVVNTQVEVIFEPDGMDGKHTLIRLRHFNFQDPMAVELHQADWALVLGNLAALLEP
jgi:uncharacterized protein YndB with AHSA1/START domain